MAKKNEATRLQQVKAQVGALNDKLHDVSDQTQEYISEHPVKSTMTAFAIGMVAGAVLMKLLEHRQ